MGGYGGSLGYGRYGEITPSVVIEFGKEYLTGRSQVTIWSSICTPKKCF